MRSGRKHKKNFRRSGSNYLSNSVTSPAASSHTTLRNKSRGKRKIRNPFKRRLSKKQSKILSKKLRGNHGDSMDSSESSPDVTVIEATSVPMQESKNLILKLLGDNSAENELSTTYEDDANLLQDLDLVILAANTETYKRYCQLLRREYEHMADEEYKSMRLKVLQTLLSIPNIFSTPEFQTRYEAAARSNMKDEINTLKA